jgi:Ca-activated chloride channel family protein
MDIRPSFMVSRGGEPLPLEDVAIDATLRDLIAEVEVKQVYRNDEATNIEAVYTFPLPLDAVLLHLEVTIGERVLRGTVVEKKAAEEQYENAIADGDSAVMLEEAEPGLYTMNVGNVMAGERITVRFRYGLALRWSGDTVRFFMPTTVAPRYGASPLAPHQVPGASVENRPDGARRGAAQGRAPRVPEPPTAPAAGGGRRAARARRRARGHGSRLRAAAHRAGRGARLRPHRPRPRGPPRPARRLPAAVRRARCRPTPQRQDRRGLLGLDGGRLDPAGEAGPASILDLLQPADRLNVIAFGSHAQALFTHQEACTPLNLQRARRFCSELDANLGGTEIGSALERAYQSRTGGELPEDLLLITDGEVGDWKPVVERAVASRHRLFTVGVGSSVAEAFVRTLAARTGGACELVSPNEGMAERITRHFQRMGAPRSTDARITWPDGVVESWPTNLRHVFDGDTVIAWARFAKRPEGEVTLALDTGDGRTVRQAVPIRLNRKLDTCGRAIALARLAAALRLPELDAERGAKEALAYGLVSRWTNCIVVVERAEEEKAGHLPELRKVKQTLAAGWGGVGSARRGPVSRHCL